MKKMLILVCGFTLISSFAVAEVAFVDSGIVWDAFYRAVEAAREGKAFQDDDAHVAALGLWEGLVENGKNFDEAIKAAWQGMSSHNRDVQCAALDLWTALVEKGKGFDDAIEAARQGMSFQN